MTHISSWRRSYTSYRYSYISRSHWKKNTSTSRQKKPGKLYRYPQFGHPSCHTHRGRNMRTEWSWKRISCCRIQKKHAKQMVLILQEIPNPMSSKGVWGKKIHMFCNHLSWIAIFLNWLQANVDLTPKHWRRQPSKSCKLCLWSFCPLAASNVDSP